MWKPNVTFSRPNQQDSLWRLTYCVLIILLPTVVNTAHLDYSEDCSELAADLVFLIDSCESEDVGHSQWHLSLDAVTSLLSALDHQGSLTGRPTHVHYGLVTVSDTVNVTIPLGPHDKANFIQQVESIPYHGESSPHLLHTTSPISWPSVFSEDRPDAPNVAIVVTSGPSSSPTADVVRARLASLAMSARDNQFRLYVAEVPASSTSTSVVDAQFLASLIGNVSTRAFRWGELWTESPALRDVMDYMCIPQRHFVQAGQLEASTRGGPPGEPGLMGATGEPGQQGEPGRQGPPGDAGSPGRPGPLGHDGLSGRSGPPGQPGFEGSSPGGESGVGGVQGAQGPRGRRGPPGFPGAPSEVVGPRGVPGTVGRPGRVGGTGVVGPRGPLGEDGLIGERGPLGERGEAGPTGDVDRPSEGCAPFDNSCEDTCISLGISFRCGCYPGYQLKEDNKTCEDEDECLVNNGGCDHFCHNEEGSYTCSCLQGFTLSPNLRSCIDVDECCQQGSSLCINGNRQKCVNTYGGYVCLNVPEGYQLDPVTGALTTSHDHGWLDELLVRHEVVVGLLGWVSGLTLLVLLTLLLTWFSDDLLLRILTESQRRQKQIEEQTPREFFLFPKLSSGRGSMDRLNRPLHHPTEANSAATGLPTGSKYIDSQGFLTPNDPRTDAAMMTSTPYEPQENLPQEVAGREAMEEGEDTQEESAQSAPETPARRESMDDHQGMRPGHSKLAMYPSMEFLPDENYNCNPLSTEL